ncbi:TRAP transporter substrate-binding protein DctP [Falsiroseomonas sp. HW251]|uniref:TRAP transporter substrate-binding protein DctP n=1 Tax=Falsiroseomonas sp. HW251 TaxID=3390998 RepID=UPI003D32258D
MAEEVQGRRTVTRRATLTLAPAAALGVLFTPLIARAQARISWRLQTNWPPGNLLFDEIKGLADRVRVMSGGRLTVEMLPVGAVAGPNQTIDVVRAGVLDGHVSFSTIFSGIDAGFAPLADLPGAFDAPFQLYEYQYANGGLELMREAYARFDMFTIGTGTGSFEAIPSRVPLRRLSDFQGVKLRSPPGISSLIWQRLGAVPINLPQSEVFSALERGVIDAADDGTLAYNLQNGDYAQAKFTLLNSPHSNGFYDVSVGRARWNAVPDDLKEILQVAVRDTMIRNILRANREDIDALPQVRARGVEVAEFTPEDRATYRRLAQEVWTEWASRTPFSKRVIDNHIAYLRRIGKL